MNVNDKNSYVKGKIDLEQMKKSAENGKLDDFINKNLSKEGTEKLKSILSSKEATEKLLSTPQAKELMKKLTEGK